MAYQLPTLAYAYDALEPHFDRQTMEIHHTKHHQTYVTNANAALEKVPAELAALPVEALVAQLDKVPAEQQAVLRNNAGGHANHSLFWTVLTPHGSKTPHGSIADAIDDTFGSFEAFQEAFETAAKGRFGSGWAWLTVKNGKLAVTSTANQDSPLAPEAFGGSQSTPILGLDVWEHAYYLHYQNRRPDYINAFWNLVDWNEVERRFHAAG